jgi:hypothetical protein
MEDIRENEEPKRESLFDSLDEGGYVDIPREFYPFDSENRFLECTICGKPLHEDERYVVEKAVKRYSTGNLDTIFEYACCEDCYLEMAEKMSKESIQKLQDYTMKHQANGLAHLMLIPEERGKHCFFSNKPIEECEEFQIFAAFKGDFMSAIMFPMAVSGDVVEEMQELISEKTREELDDFGKKISPTLPQFEEDFKFRPIVL